jgi:arsenical pump membrane protein
VDRKGVVGQARPAAIGEPDEEPASTTAKRRHAALRSAAGPLGAAAAIAAAATDARGAAGAATQAWPPFVLVAGLLLVGLVAARAGLFELAGHRLFGSTQRPWVAATTAAAVVAVTTALLNLDTAAAFLTPLFAAGASAAGLDAGSFLVGAVLMSNASSLVLPGSNLTNLLVLGRTATSGVAFAERMAVPWLASVVVTASVVALFAPPTPRHHRPRAGSSRWIATPERAAPEAALRVAGIAAVAASTVALVAARNPAPWVAGVGVAAVLVAWRLHAVDPAAVREVLGPGSLVGLFGLAVGLGTVGRAWSGPARLVAGLGRLETAGLAAAASIVLNNLPAAALLGARPSPHPLALLIGLDVGPNLVPTGSLCWLVWWRAARLAGVRAPVGRALLVGALAAPLAGLAAIAALRVG